MVRQRIMPADGAVIATEPVSPIVSNAALLSEAGCRLEHACVGIHAKVTATNVDLRVAARRASGVTCFGKAAGFAVNDTAEEAVCTINPIIQTEAEAVDAGLIVFSNEAGKNLLNLNVPLSTLTDFFRRLAGAGIVPAGSLQFLQVA